MPLPQEIRAKVFGLYTNQKVLRSYHGFNTTTETDLKGYSKELKVVSGNDIHVASLGAHTAAYLELKQLKNITDEEAIEIYAICDQRNGKPNENEYDVTRIKDKYKIVSVRITRLDVLDEHVNIEIKAGDVVRFFDNGVKQVIEERLKNQAYIFQYLISRGYALPYLEYTVEQLVSEGIYKLLD